MANITTFLANNLLDHAFGGTAYTQPTCYVGLFTTNPTEPAGTGGVEVTATGTAYARQPLAAAQSAAASGSKTNATAALTWAQATAAYGTVTGVGIFDALTAGNLLASGPLTTNEVVNSGDTFSFPTSQLTETLS